MTKSGISTIIAICAAMMLSSMPTIDAIDGKTGGPVLPDGVGNVYLANPKVQAQVGLKTPVRWTTSTDRIGLGYAKWGTQDAFVKCIPSSDRLTVETRAFSMLNAFKSKGKGILGNNNIAQPLNQFNIPKGFWKIEANCFIYELAYGNTLEEFAIGKSWQEKARYIPQLFQQVMLGMLYLRRAGIIHNDIAPKNIVAGVNPITKKFDVKIIDYDFVQFAKAAISFIPPKILKQSSKDGQIAGCNKDNRSIATSIYYTITEAHPDAGLDDPIKEAIDMLVYNFNALEKGAPLKPGNKYIDSKNRVPKYLTTADKQYATALSPLIKVMVSFFSKEYDNCSIEAEVLALLGITNFK